MNGRCVCLQLGAGIGRSLVFEEEGQAARPVTALQLPGREGLFWNQRREVDCSGSAACDVLGRGPPSTRVVGLGLSDD